MLGKTRGIVLRTMRYKESSVITDIYTEAYGMRSYLVNGVRKAKAVLPFAYFQPGTFLDLEVYEQPHGKLLRIRDARLEHIFPPWSEEPLHGGLVAFFCEVVKRVVREQSADPDFFRFLHQAISSIRVREQVDIWAVPQFLVSLMQFSGFAIPEETYAPKSFFDLQEGKFTPVIPGHIYYLSPRRSEQLFRFLDRVETGGSGPDKDADWRELTEDLLGFYKFRFEQFQKPHSLRILEQLFDHPLDAE